MNKIRGTIIFITIVGTFLITAFIFLSGRPNLPSMLQSDSSPNQTSLTIINQINLPTSSGEIQQGQTNNNQQPIQVTQSSQNTDNIDAEDSFADGKAWDYDADAKTMTWTGPTDGSEDIWQADGEPLKKIRAGYTAYFKIDISMIIDIGIGSIDGDLISKYYVVNKKIQISAGQHYVTSPGKQGGFRVHPKR